MSVRVRFAPSPTGSMHVGNARTALFNYLFARNQKGKLIVRIEDTDRERHQEESTISILKNLEWLGLDWDEGVFIGSNNKITSKGSYGPYRQSERLDIYKKEAEKLIEQGKAYYCFMSESEEQEMKNAVLQKGEAYRPSSPYRNKSLDEAKKRMESGEKFCIRFKNSPETKEYEVQDLVRGKVLFSSEIAGDFILIRSDGYPVYNFSCAIDDALMKITHVLRGEEHLPNTLKQMLIHKALGFQTPKIGHMSVILGSDKKKLSKRSGAKTVEDYREEGFLPSAMINFLSLLGWNPGTEREFYNIKDLIRDFSSQGLNASAAIFDEDKLLWLNKEHLKEMSNKQIWELVQPFLEKQNIAISKKWKEIDSILEATRTGFKNFSQSVEILKNFSDNIEQSFVVSPKCKEIFEWPKSKEIVELWKKTLEENSKTYMTLEEFQDLQKKLQKDLDVKGKNFFMPLRCAVLGEPQGMEIKILASLLPKEDLIARADKLLKSL